MFIKGIICNDKIYTINSKLAGTAMCKNTFEVVLEYNDSGKSNFFMLSYFFFAPVR